MINKTNKAATALLIFSFLAVQLFSVVPIGVSADDNPPLDTGSITICKMIVDDEGNIATSSESLPTGLFSIDFSENEDLSDSTTISFDSEYFTPNKSIILGENDAQCETFDNLSIKKYYYGEENISGTDWTLKGYNDQYTISVDSIDDFLPYSKNTEVNLNSDGAIQLENNVPDRTLVILNQYNLDEPNPPTSFEIIASKITCEDEVDLPNWGAGGPDINADTVSDFLASHQSCFLEEGRSFQWGYDNKEGTSGVSDPGSDFIGEAVKTGDAYDEWKTFGPTDISGQAEVEISDLKDSSKIWVREVLTEDDQVFFSEPPIIGEVESKDDISAEMYCYQDVLNYDNYDYVINPEPENTYYCVAFNVSKKEEPAPSCLLPQFFDADSQGDTTKDPIEDSYDGSEKDIQTILEDAGYNGVDTEDDQTQYQTWNAEKDITNLNVKFLDRYAVQNAVFGYYKDGDTETFVPVFRSGSVTGYESVSAFVKGDDADFSISGTGNVSFAIITQSGEIQTLFSTENSKNGGDDHALVYHVEDNKYIIGFEDLNFSHSDKDYNDIVVLIEVLNCADEQENTPPHINLQGDNPLEIILGSEYLEPGYTASDLEDGDLTSEVIVDADAIDPDTLGTYIVTYYVEDSEGLSATAERTVNVIEINICELIDEQNGWLGSYYDYPRSHPDMNLDEEDWGITYGDPLSVVDSWNTDWYQSKYFKFAQVDSDLMFGSSFFPVDHIIPAEGYINNHNYYFGIHWQAKVIVPSEGDYGYYLTSDDDSWIYVDGELIAQNPGVHPANVQFSGNIHMTGTHIVDVFFAERHTVQSNMNFEIEGEEVIIEPYAEECEIPNTPPEITLIGANPFEIVLGNEFTDPGATATDLEDGDLTSEILATGSVSTTTLGTYTLTYSVYDSGGLGATTTRSVIVSTTTPPVNTPPTITLIGNDPLEWNLDTPFVDPGATATDLEDGDATTTANIIVTGTVNASTTGAYILTYSIHDSGGLGATTTRTVNVVDNSIPPEPPTPPSPPNGGGGGGMGGHRHPVGEILGATSCSYLIDYLKIDWQNDPIEVLKLQSFLNVFENESLSLTGIFDQTTFEAVERFQIKYSGDILNPWGENVTTGFVYILTKKKINEIYCNTMYPISQAEQNEIDFFRTFGENNPNIETTDSATGSLFVPSDISNVLEDGSSVSPVVELKDNSSATTSALRNIAISLFAFPQKAFGKLFESRGYVSVLLFLILVAIIITVIKLFTNPKDSSNISDTSITPTAEMDDDKEESPVIVLPGISKEKKENSEILPDEEIIVENPEEEPEEIIINTPDLRTDKTDLSTDEQTSNKRKTN